MPLIHDYIDKFNSQVCINHYGISGPDFVKLCYNTGSYISEKTNLEDIVVISKRTSLEQVTSFLGCILYGRIPLIIQHPSLKVSAEDFRTKMLKIDSVLHPNLCVCDSEDRELYNSFWNSFCILKEDLGQIKAPPDRKEDETAFIQLSSGTTGLPKIITVSHNKLVNHCLTYGKVLKISDDKVVSWLPLYHDMGLIAGFLLPIVWGIPFIQIWPFEWLKNPRLFLQLIQENKATLTWFPNFAFSLYGRKIDFDGDLTSMRSFISCSEVTSQNDIQCFLDKYNKNGINENQISVCYAMAENVFAVSQSNGVSAKDGVVSCGNLIPSVDVFLTDNQGDIYIKSPFVPEITPQPKKINGYTCTGDVGFIDDEQIYVLGRSDDMIISCGVNIFPYEVERILSEMSCIIPGRVVCFGLRDEKLGSENIVIVAESESDDLAKARMDITKTATRILDVSPKVFLFERGWIIKTSSGKASRKATRKKLVELLHENTDLY